MILCSTLLIIAWDSRKRGLDVTGELSNAEFHPGIGVVIERKLTKQSGFKTGLFFKNYYFNGTVTVSTGTQIYSAPLRIMEHYSSIPVLFKWYTRIINVSAGPTFDYYTGFTQKKKSALFTISDYTTRPRISLDLLLKISKSFPLKKKLLLEPELRLNPNFSYERTFAGLGIAVKYKLD